MLKPEAEVEAALAGLCAGRRGPRRTAPASSSTTDPVLRDVVQALYRREFGRMTPAAVVAALAAEKVRGRPGGPARGSGGRRCARALRGLLGAWAGQQVPARPLRRRGVSRSARRRPTAVARAGRREPATSRCRRSSPSPRGASAPGCRSPGWRWTRSPGRCAPRRGRRTPTSPGSPACCRAAAAAPSSSRSSTATSPRCRRPASCPRRGSCAGRSSRRRSTAPAQRRRPGCGSRPRRWPQLEALAGLLGVRRRLPPPVAGAAGGAGARDRDGHPAGRRRRAGRGARARAARRESRDRRRGDRPAQDGRSSRPASTPSSTAATADGRVRLVFAVGGGRLLVRVENRGRPLAALPAAGGARAARRAAAAGA